MDVLESFNSLGELAIHLAHAEAHIYHRLEKGLTRALEVIENDAIDQFGHYQPAVGPHPGWPELADATKTDRVAKGFTENDPLYRSGELQAHTRREQHGLTGVVGNTSEIMAYQEFGTATIPARPVYGPAGFRNIDNIRILAGAALMSGLFSGRDINEALGYTQHVRGY